MIPLEEIRRARELLAGKLSCARRSSAWTRVLYLKLENLQPIGSFKLRGALNAIGNAPPVGAGGRRRHRERREHGPGRRLGRPRARPALHGGRARERAGGEARARSSGSAGAIVKVPYERWWQTLADSGYPELRRLLHPPRAGRARDGGQRDDRPRAPRRTLRTPTSCLVPFGGGGLSSGIASAVKALRPRRRSTRSEPETGRAADGGLRGRRAAPIDFRAVVRGRRRRPAVLPGDVAARARKCWTVRSRSSLGRDRRRRCACLARSARTWSPRALARSALAAALAGRRGGRNGGLHRLGREHRRGEARHDPGRRGLPRRLPLRAAPAAARVDELRGSRPHAGLLELLTVTEAAGDAARLGLLLGEHERDRRCRCGRRGPCGRCDGRSPCPPRADRS